MPIVIKSCWKVPKNPESSKGENYLMINGIIALKSPAHIPWQTLSNIYNLRSAKNIRIPTVKAA